MNQDVKKSNFALTAIAGCIFLFNQSAYALQMLEDYDLRKVDGQDGLMINTEYTDINIDELYWMDKSGGADNTEVELKASAEGVKIAKNPAYNGGDYTLGTQIKVGVGSDVAGKAGIDLDIVSQPSTISVDNFKICEADVCDSIGAKLAIQTGTPLHIGLKTTDGLFNKNAQASLDLGIKNANIFIGLPVSDDNNNTYNQFILKNTNFNFSGKGVAYIDDIEGFVLSTNVGLGLVNTDQSPSSAYGYIDLSRVPLPDGLEQADADTSTYYMDDKATGSGLNLEIMTKKQGVIDPNNPVFDANTDAKGLIRVGASGRMVNSFLRIRGTDASGVIARESDSVLGYVSDASGTTNILPNTVQGENKSVMGSTGIALRLRGEFTREGDKMLQGDNSKAVKLEIGGAGRNTFGFEFSELSPLISNSKNRAYFDSGNVYINLAKTQHLLLPENKVLNEARFGGVAADRLTNANDYIQQIHQRTAQEGNPRSVVVAVRGADFQAVSKRGRFTSSAGMLDPNNVIAPTAGIDNEWGLGLPFYNLNANLAMYTTQYQGAYYTLNNNQVVTVPITTPSDRLGFALGLSVQGKSEDGTKTTSIVVVDAKQDMYIGLRNIDMLLRGYGSLGLEGGQVNVDLPNLLMVMSAQIAGGFFPKYVNPNTPQNGIDNLFDSDNDVIMGLNVRLLGDMNFSLIPNNSVEDGNRLSIAGRYNIHKYTAQERGSAVQLRDPIDGSMIGLDNIDGVVGFNNNIIINKDNVGFHFGLHFNPDRQADKVFRVRDINLYPQANNGQRLGEMVLTGGRLDAQMNITPRN